MKRIVNNESALRYYVYIFNRYGRTLTSTRNKLHQIIRKEKLLTPHQTKHTPNRRQIKENNEDKPIDKYYNKYKTLLQTFFLLSFSRSQKNHIYHTQPFCLLKLSKLIDLIMQCCLSYTFSQFTLFHRDHIYKIANSITLYINYNILSHKSEYRVS